MLKRRTLLVSAAIVCLVLGAFGGVALAQDKPPVRIAAIAPLSGAGAFDGQLAVEGMEAMAAVINAQGGVLGGRKIALIKYDDKGGRRERRQACHRAG
jgi:branched-chain amino acid transport system substrate-binding protein